jgi:Conserved hypothetical phage protein (DUF2376).
LKAATAQREPFPWQQAMGIAFAWLRLSPKDFWAMSPRELAAALSVFEPGEGQALQRRELEELMRLFPDAGVPGSKGGGRQDG